MHLTTLVESELKANPQQHLLMKLQHIEHNLHKVATELSSVANNPEVRHCSLEQYDKQKIDLNVNYSMYRM